MNEKTKKTVIAAMFAALICAATMLIRIPTVTKGYVNLGDCFVLIAAWICGANWGFAAAAIGSALADLIAGYVIFSPATFVIKGIMALIAFFTLKAFASHAAVGRIVSAAAAELFMAFGYFVFEWIFITGNMVSAAAGIPENLIQGGVGLLAAASLMTALEHTKAADMLRFK